MDASTLPVRMTKDGLKAIMPFATQAHLDAFCDPLNNAMVKYDINTPLRVAAFLAQIAHESGEMNYTKEIASGKAYDTGALAAQLGNTPEADGDGELYKGRGLIQITGRGNYAALSKSVGVDFVAKPELLEGPVYAAESAGWFWMGKQLNAFADIQDFLTITRRINGSTTGFTSRLEYYVRARKFFKI